MYKLIECYDAGGDLSKEWFVKYHFLKPDALRKPGESIWERFKIGNTINSLHTKTERRKQMKVITKGLRTLFKNGFNPFVQFNMCGVVTYEGHSISACIDQYLDEIEPDVKGSTFRKYKSHMLLFKDWLHSSGKGGTQIYNVKKDLIYSFMKAHQRQEQPDGSIKTWSNKTYNHYLNAIHGFFQHMMDNHDDLVEKNPCRTLKRPQPNKKGNRPFDNHEFTTTLRYLKEHDPIMYRFCGFVYYSCFRPDAECRMLKIGDIDLHSRRIRIGDDITKGKATQVIPIDNEFADFISDMKLSKYPRSWYVFGKSGQPGPTPAHEGYYTKYFLPIKRNLGLHPDITLYAFKHTRAIHMVEDDEKLYNIIKFTRHKTLANLMDYLKDMGVIIGETKDFKSRKL